nr:putative phage tail protein [Sphingomonas sp. CARO-RG-8B-R24-01]
MPRGAVWADDPTSVQSTMIGALSKSLWRSDAAAVQLLQDAFPATTDALLGEWEATLGLPDPVIGPGATPDQRRAQVIAKLIGAGGQSRQRFVDFAATLGFTVTIRNYGPMRSGHVNVGDAVYGAIWADAWGVHIVTNTGGLPAATLKAELDAIKPAETTVLLI